MKMNEKIKYFYFNGRLERFVCSECEWEGGIVKRLWVDGWRPHYCPNCGAKIIDCEK